MNCVIGCLLDLGPNERSIERLSLCKFGLSKLPYSDQVAILFQMVGNESVRTVVHLNFNSFLGDEHNY